MQHVRSGRTVSELFKPLRKIRREDKILHKKLMKTNTTDNSLKNRKKLWMNYIQYLEI